MELTDLPNDQRCTRQSSTPWRCPLPRLPNKCFCHKHLILNRSRPKSNSTPANISSREIWAFRENSNAHPNLYARVVSIKKSSVQVTPLVPLSTNVGCGPFRVSDSETTMEMSQFSHRAWFVMEPDGLYSILPKKGEVWAVDVYGFVEIVSSFDDEQGAKGLLLEQGQEGFQRKRDGKIEPTRTFQKDEIGMFQYRVLGADDACNSRAGFSKHQVASRSLSNESGTQKAPNRAVNKRKYCRKQNAAGNSQPPGAMDCSNQPLENHHVLPCTSNEHQVASQIISNELKRQKAPPHPRKRKINNERHSLAGTVTLWKDGTRRSTRHRFRPLEHWRGERLLYGCIRDSFPTVIGVKYACLGAESLKVESYVSDEFADLVNLAAKG